MIDIHAYHLLFTLQIKLQSQDSSSPLTSAMLNCYKPQLPLLAVAALMESHAHLLLARQHQGEKEEDGVDSQHRYQLAALSAEKGLSALQQYGYPDEVLRSELLLQSALIELERRPILHRSTVPDRLIEALKVISSLQLDHKQAYLCYCKLAEFFAFQSNLHDPVAEQEGEKPKPSSFQKSPRQTSRSGAKQSAQGYSSSNRQERELLRGKTLQSYLGWCAVKTAPSCLLGLEKLQQASAELHNKELVKGIPDKHLAALPDCTLLEVCGSSRLMERLLSGDELLVPLDRLLPLAQSPTNPHRLTWFTLLGHFSHQLQRCFFWQPLSSSSTSSSSSKWGLHSHSLTHLLTPSLIPLREFLSSRCSLFSSQCSLPSVPTILLQTASNSPAAPLAEFSHLSAKEPEASIIWSTALGSCAHMLLALSSKPIKSQHSPVPSGGFEVHVIRNTPEVFHQLHLMWVELGEACMAYLPQQTARPLSRSPSRMRRKSIEQGRLSLPAELEVCVCGVCVCAYGYNRVCLCL